MMVVDQLVVQHQTLRNKTSEADSDVEMNEILAFMDQVQAASGHIESPPQREQLQSILFHWNGYVHERTGIYPGKKLFPYSPMSVEQFQDESTARVNSSTPKIDFPYAPRVIWVIAILLILSSIVLVAWPLLNRDETESVSNSEMTSEEIDSIDALTTAVSGNTLTETGSITPTTTAEFMGELPPPDPETGQIVITTTPLPQTAVSDPSDQLTPTPTGPLTYTVKSGDTLFSIARTFNTNVDTILAQNGLTSASSLQIGQVLILPPQAVSPVQPTNAETDISQTAVLPQTPYVETILRGKSTLYSGPGDQFTAINQLPRGTFLFTIGRSANSNWLLVQLEDGITRGWISTENLAFIIPIDPAAIPQVTTP